MTSRVGEDRAKAIENNAVQMADMLKLISHPVRLKIMYSILEDSLTVGELVAASGLSQSALSQHLAKFREAGVVVTERSGQEIRYRGSSVKLEAVLNLLETLYCRL